MFASIINGFLPVHEPLINLPNRFKKLEQIADELPSLIKNHTLKDAVTNLEELDLSDIDDQAVYQRLYVIYTLLVQAWVWENGEHNIRRIVPIQLSVPLWYISDILKIKPILTHAGVDLWNWKLKNPSGGVVLDNLELISSLTGTQDEAWFYLIMTAIEGLGKDIIKVIESIYKPSRYHTIDYKDTDQLLTSQLNKLHTLIKDANKILNRMPEKCKPDIFYNTLRPFLTGSTNKELFPDGIVYCGVNDNKPVRLNGGSAAESSLIPVIDIFLGVKHSDPEVVRFLSAMRDYMPGDHRRFLEFLEEYNYPLRQHVLSSGKDCIIAYNNCVLGIAKFRSDHMLLVTRYIMKQVKKGVLGQEGTGGTALNSFLKKILLATESVKILV